MDEHANRADEQRGPSTTTAIVRLKRSVRSTSGALPPCVEAIARASPPTTVRVPVATTTPTPRPGSPRSQRMPCSCGRRAGCPPRRASRDPWAPAAIRRLSIDSSISSPCASRSCRSAAPAGRSRAARRRPARAGGLELDGPAVPQHGRADGHQALQRLALPLGIPLLPGAEGRVDEQHEADESASV